MKTVLVDCTIKGSGGSVTYYKNLINRLPGRAESDDKIRFVYLVNESLKSLFSLDVLNSAEIIQENKLNGYRRYLWFYFNLKKLKIKYNASLLFIPYQMSVSFGELPQVLMVRNMEPFFYHTYEYPFKEMIRNFFIKVGTSVSLQKAHKTIAVSSFVKDYLTSNMSIPVRKIHKIYHGIEESFMDNASTKAMELLSGKGVEKPFILASGSFRPYRRFEDVIRAFNLLKEDWKEESTLQLVLVGKGLEHYEEKISNLIQASPYKKDILNLGFVDKKQMVVLYDSCEVYIATTEVEACPNIAIESMIAGCSVIAAKTKPLLEIYQDAAIFYDQRDCTQLFHQMKNLIIDRSIGKLELSKKALNRVRTFSWDRCADETFLFLKETVSKI